MFISKRITMAIIKIGRFYSSNVVLGNAFEEKFTAAEREKILDILNSSNADELSKFKVTRSRLKNLVNWKNKNGPFSTLSEILEVDGLGINILDRLCQSILSEDIIDADKQKRLAIKKLRKTILVPNLCIENINDLTCAVGLHIESAGISWAKLQKENNELVCWNYSDFSALPKKVLPTDAFQFANKLINSIPPADIYILESRQNSGPNKNPTKATPHSPQQLELTSMLIALLNTSPKHNLEQLGPVTDHYPNKIHYLKNRLPARIFSQELSGHGIVKFVKRYIGRNKSSMKISVEWSRLFGALVGTERVSIEETIVNIITGNSNSSLPCSQVMIDPVLIDDYRKCLKGYKDLLGQALLLVITFMELFVYNNPHSLKAIDRGRRK